MRARSSFVAAAMTLACALSCACSESPGDAAPEPRGASPRPEGAAPPGMTWIPGGTFVMGSSSREALRDEQPPHEVHVDGFWIDTHEVTNAEFAAFVQATGYVTTAEKTPRAEDILAQMPAGTPAPPPESLVAGAIVFQKPPPGGGELSWWRFQKGANWRHPEGPSSSIAERMKHPVVQVSWFDAKAYAKWAGKRLPSEAEWECAARGGRATDYVWGDEKDREHELANLFQGQFPVRNRALDGYTATAPVGSFPANGFGLFDMSGNVWEWCEDWFDATEYARRFAAAKGGLIRNPRGAPKAYDPADRHAPLAPKRVMRGGSFLCNDSYCIGYRPSARMKSTPDTGLCHTGFRCAKSPR